MFHRVFLSVLCALFCSASLAHANTTPEERTSALIQAFKAVRTAPEGKNLSSEDTRANTVAYTALDSFFDYDAITRASVQPHAAKFSKQQLTRFYSTFEELIRLIAYPKSGDFLREATLRFGKSTAKNDRQSQVPMTARLPKEDVETKVHFVWEKNKNQWYLTDAQFDGASLIKDYQNQFGRIIAKEGVEGLLKRLDTKLTERRKHL